MTVNDVAVARGRHAPLGQVGASNFVEYGVVAARAALADSGIAWTDVDLDRRRRDRPQRLRRLRRRCHLRPGARLERRPRRHLVRRVRHRRAGPGHRPRTDPGGPLRGRPGRRRRHHPQGLPRPERRRALGRPGLAAVPPARHDQPGVLRALRAPSDGPVRRDAARTSPQVKVKNARHGLHNPNARYRKEVDRPGRAGAPRSSPTRCTCSTSARRPTAPRRWSSARPSTRGSTAWPNPCEIKAISTVTPTFPNTVIDMPLMSTESARPRRRSRSAPSRSRSGTRRTRRPGIGPEDVDVAEVYDLSTALELDWIEDLALCKRGEAEQLLRAGDTTIGGRIPVNPSGRAGLLRRGRSGPGARAGVRAHLAAARTGRGPAGRGCPRRHHRQPGALRPRLLGHPEPLAA